jgi:hypothetical protein
VGTYGNGLLTCFSLIDEVLKFFERAYFIQKGEDVKHEAAVQNGRPKKE